MTTQTDALAPALTEGALAPGPSGCLVFGSLSEMRNNALSFLLDCQRTHGDVARIHLVKHVHLLSHPDHIKHVLQDRHTSYRKGFFYERLKALAGNGLVTSEGDFWLRQRRLAAPAFHRQRIAALQSAMVRRTREMLDEWEEKAGQDIDVHAELTRLTLAIAGETLFSVDLLEDAKGVGEAARDALTIVNQRTNSLFVMPEIIPTPSNRKFQKAVRTLDELVYRLIKERRAQKAGAENDLLQMFLDAKDEDTGEQMNDEQLRDEVLTMLVAGHDTTANGLSWFFYELSKHPHVDKAVAAEGRAVFGEQDPSPDDIEKLEYTPRALLEALRLHPPAWLISREAKDDDVIGGYPIPKDSTVMLSSWVVHRHPEFWPNPEGFDPDRFLPGEVAKRPKLAFFPFASGPRKCIGEAFAHLEMRTIVPMIARRFRLSLIPGHEPQHDPTVTLSVRNGMHMTVTPRDS